MFINIFPVGLDKPTVVNKLLYNLKTIFFPSREQQKATGAKHLLLCYMRGKLPDVDSILEFCKVTNNNKIPEQI